MKGFLIDTNTVCELVSVKPNQRVLDWMEAATLARGVRNGVGDIL
jgi:predicted nucleic acid-binding protein